MEAAERRWVVVGRTVYGPFDSRDEAVTWKREQRGEMFRLTASVRELTAPVEIRAGSSGEAAAL